jgi:hypothetical protein
MGGDIPRQSGIKIGSKTVQIRQFWSMIFYMVGVAEKRLKVTKRVDTRPKLMCDV